MISPDGDAVPGASRTMRSSSAARATTDEYPVAPLENTCEYDVNVDAGPSVVDIAGGLVACRPSTQLSRWFAGTGVI